MNRDDRKRLTMELAELVRKQLSEVKIDANVRCHFYVHSRCMVSVYPRSKEYRALSHWEQTAYNSGVEYWLNTWLQLQNKERWPEFMEAAKIYGG